MEIEVVKDPSGMWRVKNAPLISTGIEYPLASGPTTFTESQLADAVAAQNDPAIVGPRIKLGHTSDYNDALIGDAEMAFGQIDASTMKLGDNNQTIYGDYLVPEWLGTVMPIAFPNRSIEGNFDVETATGKMYELVITAVSLLGIYWPGCQVLEDLPLWYGGDIPDGVEFDDAIAAKLAASQVAAKGGRMPKKQVLADTDTSRIRRQFYDMAMSNELEVEADTYWWWIRAERYADSGGLYLIAEDEDNGDLYRFDVQVSDQEVAFSAPSPVKVEYVDRTAAARAAVVAGMAAMDESLAVHASRAETGGPETTTQGGVRMDAAQRKKLAASLSLPEDATEEQITAKLTSNALASVDETGSNPDEGRGEQPKEYPPVGTGPEDPNEPGTQGAPPAGTDDAAEQRAAENDDPDAEASRVSVDRKVWEETRANAALARQHEEDRKKERIDADINAALKAGKFTPASEKVYRDLLVSNYDQGMAVINSLQAGMVPTDERGSAGNGGDGGVAAGAADGALPLEWFPEIADMRARAGHPVTQAKEG